MLGHSINIGTYAKIPIKIHWSFFLVLIYIAWISHSEGLDLNLTLSLAVHVFLLFLCVVFHEYGHAIAARKYGIKTRDIILSPIGGLARLESIPDKPMAQFVIAFAGPLVNLVIFLTAGIVYLIFNSFIFRPQSIVDLDYFKHPSSLLFPILIINAVLFLFNLIPAYPMDGGRILKSLLCLKFDKYKATIIAANIGRVFAIAFLALGAYQKYFALLFIGLFIYVTATKEHHFAKMRRKHSLEK